MKPRLVILDRDGVINRDSSAFVKSAAEWNALPGSMQAIGMLTRAGIPVSVASNQSGIGRGLFSRSVLYSMHRKMRRLAAEQGGRIERIAVCPHRPNDDCECRKPLPGMLNKLMSGHGVSPAQVVVVGDSLRDIDAATAAGAQPVLVLTGNGLATRAALQGRAQDVATFNDLLDFAKSVDDDQD